MRNLELFNRLPEDYKVTVNSIIENALGDESPDMNDAFRVWQAEIFEAGGGATAEDGWPDLKMIESEALAFRGGWEGRDKAEGVLL